MHLKQVERSFGLRPQDDISPLTSYNSKGKSSGSLKKVALCPVVSSILGSSVSTLCFFKYPIALSKSATAKAKCLNPEASGFVILLGGFGN
jgi:hypothetical protein